MLKPIESTLVIGPSWVGDMILAQSLFITLKTQTPDLAIDVASPAWSLPILARMPEVRQSIGLKSQHGQLGLMERYRAGKSLQPQQYQRAIVLPRSFKSALVPLFAKIPHRMGFNGEMRQYGLLNDTRPLNKALLNQTVKRFVTFAYESNEDFGNANTPCPYPKLQVDKKRQQQLLSKFNLTHSAPIVVIMPGAEYGPAKQWPIAHYAELIAKLDKLGIQSCIIGSEKERTLGENIAQKAGGKGLNLCGQTSLTDAIDFIATADIAVSNDSGLMHIAAAVDCPVIAIYGSSDPSFTPPLSKQAEVMYLDLACSPCFKRYCPLKHLNCLKQIYVDQVLDKIKQRLNLE